MTATISKWGNSKGLRLPKDIIESLHLAVGDKMNIFIKDEKVILEPLKRERARFDINELVARIPADHTSTEEIPSQVGLEKW